VRLHRLRYCGDSLALQQPALSSIMSVNAAAISFDSLALSSVAVILVLFLITEYKRRSRLSLEERLLKRENASNGSNDDKTKTFWTLQQYDEIRGKPWYALLEQDDAGIVRGWTGYRPELEALSRILNITSQELPPTTAQEFFIRTNISTLRPIAAPHPLAAPITPPLRRGPANDDDSEISMT
jgi:hypothetical protein